MRKSINRAMPASLSMSETAKIKDAVKSAYGSLATSRTIPLDQGCCEPETKDKLLRYGYSKEELGSLPESVIAMSDGCGNPTGLGMIQIFEKAQVILFSP